MQIDLEPHEYRRENETRREPIFGPNAGSNAGNLAFHFVIGLVMVWLFFEPISSTVAEWVRLLLPQA